MRKTIHLNTTGDTRGFIQGRQMFACGIESSLPVLVLDSLARTDDIVYVTCDWCKIAVDSKKDDIDTKIEKAIEAGIEKGLAKISKDFAEAKQTLEFLVANGVEKGMQRSSVRTNLIGIAKIAEDEIQDEYADSDDKVEYDQARKEDMKDAVREVLQEAAPGQLGSQFVQNVYPDALDSAAIYRQSRAIAQTLAGVETEAVNVSVEAVVDPADFRTMIREVLEEFDEDTAKEYEEDETALMQKAVASVFASDQFGDLFKKLVKDALVESDMEQDENQIAWVKKRIHEVLDERERRDAERQLELNRRLWESQLYPPFKKLPSEIIVTNGDVVEDFKTLEGKSVIHLRKLYSTALWCGDDSGSNTVWRNGVTCRDCKAAAGID